MFNFPITCSLILLLCLANNSVQAQERICPDGKRSYFGVCPQDENNSRPISKQDPIPSTTGQGTILSPRDVLIGAFVGTSSQKCGSGTGFVYRLENDSLVGEYRGNGNLISKHIIRLDSAKYLGSFNGMHRVAYINISENPSNQTQTVIKITMETDFKIRRTLVSTRGNEQLIKDGVVLASNQKVPDVIKCS